MLASSRFQGAPGSGWLGMGSSSRKEQPLTLDFFHILTDIKLFPSLSTTLHQVLSLPLSQKVYFLKKKKV